VLECVTPETILPIVQYTFPFTDIVGQKQLKTALLLVAVDPKLGGLLISGSRGSAKSTLARGLTSILKESPFVTLPLGATEEMITGSFDLESALNQAKLKFKSGLLNRAHGGVLYVDEVNLLPDHLVDLLLDSAASGVNIIERDGISHQQESQFSLIGTMNPDEGELRPQLLDRFGLMAEIEDDFSIEDRRLIVKKRIEFDDNPEKFVADSRIDTDDLIAQVNFAVSSLTQVILCESMSTEIARRCIDASVDGLRADLTFHRASRAHAALHGRNQVNIDDINAVESLVLLHRKNSTTPNSSPPPATDNGGNQGNDNDDTPQDNSPGGSSIQGSWGAVAAGNPLAVASMPIELGEFSKPPKNSTRTGRGNLNFRSGAESSRYISRDTGDSKNPDKKIDWRKTLCSTSSSNGQIQFKLPIPKSQSLDLILLDISASTFSGNGFARAKGALQQISRQCYLKRRRLCIVTFGNNKVKTLLHPQRAPKELSRLLDTIHPGGGTPWKQVLEYTDSLLKRQQFQSMDCHIYLVTDGRLSVNSLQHPLLTRYPITVLDIESSRIKLGLGKILAQEIGGRYIQPHADSQAGIQTPKL
jgi:magnesium chelatase subunit D